MIAPEVAERTAAAPAGAVGLQAGARVTVPLAAVIAVSAVTVAGIVLRLLVARQSLFGDELSTYWIVATHGFGSMLSLLYGTASIHHAEITPPLSFIASWVTAQIGHSPQLLRAPSLVAGALTIPAVYLLGLWTVGRRAAVLAAALTALSPFMIYYSTEARAYSLMMLLVLVSTLALLRAVHGAARSGSRRWWVLYAISSCLALYTHYTCAFVLAAQLAWVWWAHPGARRPALLANLGVAAGLIPWIPGLINDFTSPTLTILSALSPFTVHAIPHILSHWAIGYPYATGGAGLAQLPGRPALALLAAAAIIAVASLGARAYREAGRGGRGWIQRTDSGIALVLALALATPVGEGLVSTFSSHIFGVRNLAASWPGLALAFAALACGAGRRAGLAVAGLTVASFAISAGLMLTPRFARPDYRAAADLIARRAPVTDIVVDETGEISPGPLTPLDVALHSPVRLFRAGSPAERQHPFGFADPVVPLARAVDQAVAAAGGRPIIVVSTLSPPGAQFAQRVEPANPSLPVPYRLVEKRVYRGIAATEVRVYAGRT